MLLVTSKGHIFKAASLHRWSR